MDFLEFFNLNEDPFRLTPDPFYYYPSESHNELLSSLNYVIEQKEGFFLAIGQPGTGKTTILKVFINTWKDKALIALVMTPRLSPEEFLATVLEDLKVNIESSNKNDIIKTFRDFLIESALKGTRVIIIVDEAQNMPFETLEELRLLSNLETDKEKLLQIVLMGQPQLKKILSSEDLKQLNQRVTVRCTLKPLSMTETSDYINYRLIKGGKGSASFAEEASNAVYAYSSGIPRLINLISSRSMMSAYLDSSNIISKKHVRYTIKHLTNDEAQPSPMEKPPSKIIKFARAAFFLIAVPAILIGLIVKYAPDIAWYNPSSSVVSRQTENDATEKPEEQNNAAEEEKQNAKPVEIVKTNGPKKIVTEKASTEKVTKETRAEENNKTISASIIVNSANVRSKPGLDEKVVAWVTEEMVFEIISKTEDSSGLKWYEIHLADGREGWISGDVVKFE